MSYGLPLVLPSFFNADGEFFDQERNFNEEEFSDLRVFEFKADIVAALPAIVISN